MHHGTTQGLIAQGRARRTVAGVVAACIAGTSLLAPMRTTAAPGQFAAQWIPYRLSALTTVSYPRDSWQLLGEVARSSAGGFDIRMIQGERWITLGREEAGTLGLSSDQISQVIHAFPRNGTHVFARYSPENAQLRITVNKVERHRDGRIRTYIADFTPHHGARWAAARQYLTDAERADVNRAGYNPFASFRGDATDPVFYHINWAAAQVAVGHAMRHHGAFAGLIAIAETRFDTRTEESGNIFRKKVKTIVEGYAKPRWYVALPVDVQTYGTSSMICVMPGATACDAWEHVAVSGVAVAEWQGGNMPAPEDLLYHWDQTRSSFTVFTFALITAALFFTGAWALGLEFTLGGAGASVAANAGLGAAEGFTIGAGTIGAAAGVSYAAGSTVLGGGGPITSVQDGYLGATGNGVFTAPAPTSEHAAAMAQRLRDRHINTPMNSGLTGTTRLYQGNCAEGWTIERCRQSGLDPGILQRPDAYAEFNTVLSLQQSYQRCRAQGLSGVELKKCAAPRAQQYACITGICRESR
jgi:hypothetical protein